MVHFYDRKHSTKAEATMLQFYLGLLKMVVEIENVSNDKIKLATPDKKVKVSCQLKMTGTLKLKLVNLSLQS